MYKFSRFFLSIVLLVTTIGPSYASGGSHASRRRFQQERRLKQELKKTHPSTLVDKYVKRVKKVRRIIEQDLIVLDDRKLTKKYEKRIKESLKKNREFYSPNIANPKLSIREKLIILLAEAFDPVKTEQLLTEKLYKYNDLYELYQSGFLTKNKTLRAAFFKSGDEKGLGVLLWVIGGIMLLPALYFIIFCTFIPNPICNHDPDES